jgi:hypothetical protein
MAGHGRKNAHKLKEKLFLATFTVFCAVEIIKLPRIEAGQPVNQNNYL